MLKSQILNNECLGCVIVLYFVPRVPDIFVRLVLILWNVYFATERLRSGKQYK